MKTESLHNVFLHSLSEKTKKDILIRQTILIPHHGWVVLFDSGSFPCAAFFEMRGGAMPELNWVKATRHTAGRPKVVLPPARP